MKIKDVEQLTGITKANIRYYESQNLLAPRREANGYRVYSNSDVETLMRIKLLRSLDVPIETLLKLHDGTITLEKALENRSTQFIMQHAQLDKSEKIISAILQAKEHYDTLNATQYLQMLDTHERDNLKKDSKFKLNLPWRRFWARCLDFSFYNLIIYLSVPIIYENPQFYLLVVLTEIMMLLVLEPVMLTLFCTTPGKIVFGMTVTNLDGGHLSYKQSLDRTILVLQYGLGFCLPFLSDFMRFSSLSTAEDGNELVWEWDSELNIRDAKRGRYFIFILFFFLLLAYPAKQEYHRLFTTNEPCYQGDFLFLDDYRVEEVIYCVEEMADLPLIRLDIDNQGQYTLGFYTEDHTTSPYDTIGTFEYVSPQENSSFIGQWMLYNISAPEQSYQLQIEKDNDILLNYLEYGQLQWSWKLSQIDTLEVGVQNEYASFYLSPEWFATRTFTGDFNILRSRNIDHSSIVTLIFEGTSPDILTITEEIYHKNGVRVNTIAANANEYGLLEFEIAPGKDEEMYAIYRIPFETGEYIWGISY